MTMTKIAQMVNPQVMADMIRAELPKKIKVSPLATIDTTLTGRPGDTITVPTFAYIGDAADVTEGNPITISQMTTSTTTAKVKKAGKGVEISDEAVLSGYGDPIGEANRQLLMSIASKIDVDAMTALTTEANLQHDDSSSNIIKYENIVDAVDKFEEEDYEPKVLFVHPKQVTQLRKDPNFLSLDKYPVPVVMNGVIGSIAGCQVVVSKRVGGSSKYECPIVKAGALTIYMKRDAMVETDRDILKKTTVITADEHYVVKVSDKSKVVVLKVKETAEM